MDNMKDKENEGVMLNLEAYKGDEPYLFVSYAHKDKNYVYLEILRLHELGFRIWYDTGIEPGQRFWKEIAAAIKKCSIFVVFLSPDAATSPNVANEISFAITRGVKLLAIHLKKTELSDELQIQIGRFQAILKYKLTEEAYIQKVVDALPKEILENKDKYFGKGSLLGDRQSSIEMADDIKIIEQIEKQIGKKLKPLPLEDIRKKNGYALDNTGKVKGLNLDGTKVKDISFLSKLGGLTHLSLANNHITDIMPLNALTNLKELQLSYNPIEDITPLAALTHLERLILIKNEISDISPLSGLIEMNTLSLSTNNIAELSPLISLTELENLWISNNHLHDITPLKALTQLKNLGLRINRITDLAPLKELTNLKGLNASKNNITKLPSDIARWWSSMEIIWVDNDATDKGLNLFDNPLTDPPIEIVKQGKAAVKTYFDSLGDRQSSITIKDEKYPFQQLLKNRGKQEVLKYCLKPGLLRKRYNMEKTLTQAVTALCILTWGVGGIIIAAGIISRAIPDMFAIYAGFINWLFGLFWGLATLTFILLICNMDFNRKKLLQKVMIRKTENPIVGTVNKITEGKILINHQQYRYLPFSLFWAAFLVIPLLGLVIETYMLIKIDYFMLILIFVLSLLAILSKLISNTPSENRIIRFHYSFIVALSLSLIIFHNYAFSEPFKTTFLKHAGFIDRWFFAQAAEKSGANYDRMMKEEIKKIQENLEIISDTDKKPSTGLEENAIKLLNEVSSKTDMLMDLNKNYIIINIAGMKPAAGEPASFDGIVIKPDKPTEMRLKEIKVNYIREIATQSWLNKWLYSGNFKYIMPEKMDGTMDYDNGTVTVILPAAQYKKIFEIDNRSNVLDGIGYYSSPAPKIFLVRK